MYCYALLNNIIEIKLYYKNITIDKPVRIDKLDKDI